MAESRYIITEHKVPCQHIREYPHATAGSHDEALQLVVKQYTPVANPCPRSGDLTIIATHANAMPKEVYEPLWEELSSSCKASGYRIRNIWMADTAWQGSSAVLNEERLGSDPHWFDHSRDLLCMINHFRDDMPRPIVGIGHSMGGAQLVFASIFHPRLFLSLVLIEPWITPKSPASGPTLGKNSTFRKDLWSSRQEGEAAMRKRYKIWEPSVLSRMVKYSLRPTPTLLYPDNDAGAVTLATPKHQEAFTIFRPNLENVGIESEPSVEERVTHPDVSLRDDVVKSPFYNTAREQAFYALESLRPTVLYIFGSQSIVATPEFRAEKLRITGTGYLGSGGVKLRQVKEVILSGSHFVPMEKPAAVADEVSKWLGEQMETYRVNEEKLDKGWSQKSAREQQMLSQQWMKSMKAWAGHIPKESKL